MKLIMENWRTHLENKDLIEAQTQALNELSEHDYEVIKNWMAEAPEEAYSFGNIFGGKKRIAIPVETGAASGPIGGIVEFFQSNGWNIDFANSTVSKESETTIPKGPRAGEKTKQIKKARIGKTLAAAQKLFDRFNEDQTEKVKNKIKEEYPEVFNAGKVMAFARKLPDLIEFWNNKSEFYRQNPEAAFEKESPFITILSRHPVDVVRMSDMNSIKSCHSRGGGYFQCAVAESRGHGPIAYLVPRKQFEQYFDVDLSKTKPEDVDLDAGGEEIFEDRERGIPGLRPEGRVRLRKYSDGSTTFAAPERRTYAPHGARTPPNFLKGVTKWALETQKKELGDPNELADAITSDEFSRFGGSYGDTQDGEVIAAMLESVIGEEKYDDLKQHGDVPDESEDEDEISAEIEDGGIEERAEQIQDRADNELKHFGVYHEIMDEEVIDGQQAVWFSGHIAFELDDLFGEAYDEDGEEISWNDREEEVSDIIDGILSSNSIYAEMGDVELYDDQWSAHWDVHDFGNNIDEFDRFVDEVKRGDDNFDEAVEEMREAFSEAGIIERIPSEYEKAITKFAHYKNITAKFDVDDHKVVASFRNPMILDKDYRNFKKYDIKTQEEIKNKFNSLFTTAAYNVLKASGKDILPVNKVFDPLKQGLHVDLDGIKVKFILDFQNVVEAPRKHLRTKSVFAIDEVKRFLNLVDSPDRFKDLIKVAQESYKKALEGAREKQPEEPQETNENKKLTNRNASDKLLFENWRKYLSI